jgi:catechol-2,3-dioxygenase
MFYASLHDVTEVKYGKIVELDVGFESYSRTLYVRDRDGNAIELSLFADKPEKLIVFEDDSK